jgi:predicted nuclease with TOPRIM domain
MSDTKDIVQRLQNHYERCEIDIERAVVEIKRLRADLAQRTAERDALAAEVAALKAHDPLAEMWRELAEYQEQADANGHGDTWRAMCHKRTEEAASAAYLARQWSSHVAAAAYGAWWAAQRDAAVRRISNDAVKWAADAVAAIRRAKEGQR